MPWLLNIAYGVVFILAAPVLLYRAIVQGKYRAGWREKLFGDLPSWPAAYDVAGRRIPRYWFHAVSVGEVLQLQTVIAELLSRQPQAEVLITSTTSTGHALIKDKFPHCQYAYFPLDFSWAVHRAMHRIRPTRLVLVELELWPNLIRFAQRFGISVMLINGRISERSFRGYSRIRWLIRPLLRTINAIAAQTEAYASRFIALGAMPQHVVVTGSVKFDRIETNRWNARTSELRTRFGLDAADVVLIAGSTQAPEEEIALDAWLLARERCPNLRLILVPRHKERFDEVAKLVQNRGLPVLRRSQLTSPISPIGRARPISPLTTRPVLLLDTLGELSACWGLADFAFVGGSLTNRGGQNMIEPAGYGAAVCFGPDTRNFQDVVDGLIEHRAATVIHNGAELAALLQSWLHDPDAARQQGERAQQFVTGQRGASQRTVELLLAAQSFTSQSRAA